MSKAISKFDCPICRKTVGDFFSPRDIDNRCPSRGSHVHHITPLSHGGKDSVENKIRICRSCHGELHGIYNYKAIQIAFNSDPLFFKKCVVDLVEMKNG